MAHEVQGVVARSAGAPVSLETVLVPDPGPGGRGGSLKPSWYGDCLPAATSPC